MELEGVDSRLRGNDGKGGGRQVHRPAAMDREPNRLSIAPGFISDGLVVIET